MKKLRPYQEQAIELIRKAYKHTKTILVQSPTGSGKTEIIFHLISSHTKKDKKSLFIVRRRQIVFQTVRRLVDAGFTCVGTIMAGQKLSPIFPIQVCSIDTIFSYVKKGELDFLRNFDAIFIDEAHDTTSDSYKSFIWWLEGKKLTEYDKDEFYKMKPKKRYFGFTATPYKIGKKTHEWWGRCVVVIKPEELRDKGYLCDAKLFIPMSINLRNVKIESTGDYNLKELYEASIQKKVMGKIVDEYIQKGLGKPAICFAVNKAHSMEIVKWFNDCNIDAMHVEDTTDQATRDYALEKIRTSFEEKKSFVLCNVNIFSTGVDIPELTVGIMARPTESKVLWYQQVGRLLRPFKGKKEAIVLDHGGNSLRFGGLFDYHAPDMNRGTYERTKPISVCPACYYYHDNVVSACRSCGTHIKSFLKTLKAGEERQIDSDDDFFMLEYTERVNVEMKEYIEHNVRYELDVNKKSEYQAWSKAYRKYGAEFVKHGINLGCPDYVMKEFEKKELMNSYDNSKLIFNT